MKEDNYALNQSPHFFEYEFISIGKNGRVKKLIQFTPTDVYGIFN